MYPEVAYIIVQILNEAEKVPNPDPVERISAVSMKIERELCEVCEQMRACERVEKFLKLTL